VTETREERAERIDAEAERSLDVINARRVRRGPEALLGCWRWASVSSRPWTCAG